MNKIAKISTHTHTHIYIYILNNLAGPLPPLVQGWFRPCISSINFGTYFVNFTNIAYLYPNVTHFNHGLPKFQIKAQTHQEELDNGFCWSISPQHWIRLKDPSPISQICKIRGVKPIRATSIQWNSLWIIFILWAKCS